MLVQNLYANGLIKSQRVMGAMLAVGAFSLAYFLFWSLSV